MENWKSPIHLATNQRLGGIVCNLYGLSIRGHCQKEVFLDWDLVALAES
jgi:hypothetical protein